MTSALPSTLAFFSLPGGMEWVIILVIGLLLFGARLPTVGRNIGKSITEFKKGLKEASDDVTSDLDQPSSLNQSAPRQLTQDEVVERATQEALRRMKAEQAANQANPGAKV